MGIARGTGRDGTLAIMGEAHMPKSWGRCGWMAAAIGTVAVSTGCTFTRSPRFEVVGVEVRERTPEAQVLAFVVEGENPNRDPLPLRTVRYSLSMDGREVFRGERSAEATLPPRGRQRFVVPAVVQDDEALDERSYSFRGTVEFLEPGTLAELLFDSNVRRSRGSFRESGRLRDQGSETSPER